DAYGPTFSLAECRSIHDIIRYTHEMAVLTMFSAGDQVIEDAGGLLRPMEIGVPFSFLVIDLGGGIRRRNPQQRRRRLALRRTLGREDVLSVPLAALCDGMTTPGLRWYAPSDIDALPEVFSRTMLDNRGARPAGAFNYALTARDYLNLNARVEFHFVMVDAVCGRDAHANYIRFRFKGGGAGLERSRRRAIFFQHVLEHNGFYTTVAGDLITASLTGADRERIREQLVMIGRLFGFSRFLDGVMGNDTIPIALAKAFLGGHFDSLAVLKGMEADQA
ncbi:MAG: pyruvate, phosphate dikinase, partial [Desulfobulbus sp.]